eukprot:CAMPEP_0167771268 /NCGR_PEP_ID=MMETSP0111_2-20121227/182_1 /TAXON_ID=91324 /ORGANISM="Lotharella globosa, Strain CCCM811" /LENGTH=60 /DNA_ID=CAMNT_0007660599 /DNA_START=248 /DNA_END=430 /DNA_ORIENTATION=+
MKKERKQSARDIGMPERSAWAYRGTGATKILATGQKPGSCMLNLHLGYMHGSIAYGHCRG